MNKLYAFYCRAYQAVFRAALPILTKPADVRRLSPEAQAVFRREVLATDLYTLAFPGDPAPGGAEWREGPRVL